MESQDNYHLPPEHASQETGPADREENTLAARTSVAILKRLRLGRPSLLPEMDETQLLAALESADWQVRVAAVQKLEECGERASIERFIRALKDEHEAVRAAAAHALGALGDPRAIAPLVEALRDATWLVRAAAVQALGMLGEHMPVEPLMLALHDEDESVRAVAVRALGTMGESVSMECLLAALQDSSWQVREMAVLTLGARREHIPRAALALALLDEDESVRRAVHFLQEMYPGRFAETAEPQTLLEQEGKQEERSNVLLPLDDERDLQHAAQHRSLQRYPRRGALHVLRLALLACWSIFLGYAVSIILNLVQLTHADLAQLTARVVVQALSVPLTALAGLNIPVWVRGVCMLLALLLFFGCLWAARDTWKEYKWMHSQGVRGEELEVGSGDHDQFTRAPVKVWPWERFSTLIEGTQGVCSQWPGRLTAHVSLLGVMTRRCRCGTQPMEIIASPIMGILLQCSQWRGRPMVGVSPLLAMMEPWKSGTLSLVGMSSPIVDILVMR